MHIIVAIVPLFGFFFILGNVKLGFVLVLSLHQRSFYSGRLALLTDSNYA